MANSLITFDQYVQEKGFDNKTVNRFWKYCNQDIPNKETGDVEWWGREATNHNDMRGYSEEFDNLFEEFKNINSSRQIKSSPNFKKYTADDIFDMFDVGLLTGTVFMDREECKNAKCGMEEFTDLMWEVAPTWLGVRDPNDVREVCRRAKNPKAKAFLEAFETAMENAKFTDKFYNSVKVHKKIQSELNHFYDPATDYIDEELTEDEEYKYSQFKVETGYYLTPQRARIDVYTVYSPNGKYLGQTSNPNKILDLIRGKRVNSSRRNNMIKSSLPAWAKSLSDDDAERRNQLQELYNEAHWEFLDYTMPCDPEWTPDMAEGDFNPLSKIHFLFENAQEIESFLANCDYAGIPGAEEKLKRMRQINTWNEAYASGPHPETWEDWSSVKSSKQIKSTLDTWVDPRSKVDGWKVKVLDVYPDDYAGSITAKVELFDPEGNSQGEENIYIHRQDVKIGETYDARIDGIMAMPRIIGVPNISYDEVPSMKNVTRERYLKSALDTVKVTFDNGDTIVTDYNADVGREEIAKYYMHNYFNVGNEDELHQVVKVEFPGNINSARVPEKADLDMAYQLEGYIESDHAMYDQFIVPVVKNLERKMKRGIFDYDKSLILWQHVADEGAKRYVKELGGPSYNVATRKEVAKNLAEYYKENYDVNGDIYNPIN